MFQKLYRDTWGINSKGQSKYPESFWDCEPLLKPHFFPEQKYAESTPGAQETCKEFSAGPLTTKLLDLSVSSR